MQNSATDETGVNAQLLSGDTSSPSTSVNIQVYIKIFIEHSAVKFDNTTYELVQLCAKEDANVELYKTIVAHSTLKTHEKRKTFSTIAQDIIMHECVALACFFLRYLKDDSYACDGHTALSKYAARKGHVDIMRSYLDMMLNDTRNTATHLSSVFQKQLNGLYDIAQIYQQENIMKIILGVKNKIYVKDFARLCDANASS